MKPLHGFVYLASPYSKYVRGHAAAALEVGAIAAALMRAGVPTFCPIAHGHAIAAKYDLPLAHEFWMDMDEPMMRSAWMCVVATMEGWQESRGVLQEIETFSKMGKTVRFLPPSVALTWSAEDLRKWVVA